MTELDPDVAPAGEAFEAAYNLPSSFPADMRALHTEILTSLRNESRALPMSTSLRMLTERMAYFYVAMKWRESDADSPLGLKEQKEMLDFWLKIMVEFNKLINASQDKARTTLLVEIQNILRQSLKNVSVPDDRKKLAREWSEEFARINV